MSKQNPTIEDSKEYKDLNKTLNDCLRRYREQRDLATTTMLQLNKANALLKVLHYGPVNTWTWTDVAKYIKDAENE